VIAGGPTESKTADSLVSFTYPSTATKLYLKVQTTSVDTNNTGRDYFCDLVLE
jgi:hypothetical protein